MGAARSSRCMGAPAWYTKWKQREEGRHDIRRCCKGDVPGQAQPVHRPSGHRGRDANLPREEHRPLQGAAGARGHGVPGRGQNPARKTKYDLVAVEKGSLLINMDSQAPNQVAQEYLPQLLPGLTAWRREQVWGIPVLTSTPRPPGSGGLWR